MQYQLDVTSFSCPIPLLLAKQALAKLHENDQLILWLNAASAVEDFAIFSQQHHCVLTSQKWLSKNRFEVIMTKRRRQ